MPEHLPKRFDVSIHPENTIARITGDDLPSPQDFASAHTESELYDLNANIDQKILDLKAEELRIGDEINRMQRAKSLIASALPLALEKGIE